MTTEIRPSRGVRDLALAEVWRRRELWYFLAWRDLKVRYKQTFFGVAWAVLQPVSLAIVFSIFLGRLARVPSDGVPYPVFVLAGLVPWTLIASALSSASKSLVQSREIITKVYFPRILIPLSSASSQLVDFLIAIGALVVVLLWYGVALGWSAILAPLIGLHAFIVAVAVGILFSAVNAKYRDVEYAVPLLTQLWLFLTPIAYPSSLVPEDWVWLYGANPAVAVVESFRWAMVGTPPPSGSILFVSIFSTMVLLVVAVAYFTRVEAEIADVV